MSQTTYAAHGPDPAESFITGLFDLGFTRFVSLRIMKMVYSLSIAVVSLMSLALFVVLAQKGLLATMFGLIATPLLWLFAVALLRLALEAFAMLFRINDNLVLLASQTAGHDSQVG